jgi:hypothetical protein
MTSDLAPGMNSMPKFIRSSICHGCHEIDLRSDFPSILLAELQRSHPEGWGYLKRVINKDHSVPKIEINKTFCSPFPPQKGEMSSDAFDFLTAYRNELDLAFEILKTRPDWSPIWVHVSEDTSKSGPRGTFMFHVAKHGQNVVVSETVNFLNRENLCVVELAVHDAIILRCEDPHSLLQEINNRMKDYGFPHSQFVYKGQLVFNEMERPLNLCVDRPPNTQLLFQVLSEAQTKRYVRLSGVACLYRKINDWTIVKTGKDVHELLSNVHIDNCSRCDANTAKVFEQLGTTKGKALNFPRFPLLHENDIHRGYTALKDAWIDWDAETINSYPVPAKGYILHYYDQNCPVPLSGRVAVPLSEVVTETPSFDNVFTYQWGPDKELIDYVQVFLGRLRYPIGKWDSFQSFLYFYGSSQSGKSTVLSVVAKCWFPPEKVRSWSKEGTFGLEGALNSWLVMHDEVVPDARDESVIPGLSRDNFNTMTAGGPVTVARKHAVAENVFWSTPGFAVSNYTFPLLLADVEGEIFRRLVAFHFPKSVDANTRDHNLERKLESEALLFQIKCCLKYRLACTVWRDPHDPAWVPGIVKTWNGRAQNDTNLCARFLAQREWHSIVEYSKGDSVSYVKFMQLLGEWRSETRQPFSTLPKKPKVVRTLKEFNFEFKNVTHTTEEGKRTSIDKIINMKLVDTSRPVVDGDSICFKRQRIQY